MANYGDVSRLHKLYRRMSSVKKLKFAIEAAQGLADIQNVRGGQYPKLIHGDLKVSFLKCFYITQIICK